MTTWQYLVRLARYQPRYFVQLAARTISIALIPQGVALTTRAIFDNITNEQAATVGFWSLAAILVGLAVTRSLIIFGNVVLSVRVEFTFATLLRKNVFDHVLDQPGNRALPESTGEAGDAVPGGRRLHHPVPAAVRLRVPARGVRRGGALSSWSRSAR